MLAGIPGLEGCSTVWLALEGDIEHVGMRVSSSAVVVDRG